MRLQYGSNDPDFQLIVRQYPDREFENLTRSTIPMLCYWNKPDATLKRVLSHAGLVPPFNGDLCFEFPVKSIPRGKPSFTDIMYVSPSVAVGIEAKSTEPRYPTVAEHLRVVKSDTNKLLDHWVDPIDRTGAKVHKPSLDNLPYQMVHRLASLCSIKSDRHILVYQVFAIAEEHPHYLADLKALHQAIGSPDHLEFWVQTIDTVRTSDWNSTLAIIQNGPASAPLIVRNAILAGNLFQFGPDHLYHVP
jgi:hypothetical protein